MEYGTAHLLFITYMHEHTLNIGHNMDYDFKTPQQWLCRGEFPSQHNQYQIIVRLRSRIYYQKLRKTSWRYINPDLVLYKIGLFWLCYIINVNNLKIVLFWLGIGDPGKYIWILFT